MGTKTTTKEKSNNTTTAAPPSWALPGMQTTAAGITDALGQIKDLQYGGDFVAAPGQMSLDAPAAYLNAAQLAQQMINPATQAVNAAGVMPTYGGPDLSAATGSFGGTGGMDAAILAATHPVMRNLTENLLPSLQSSGIESGAYGGTRAQQTLPAQIIRDSNAEMMDIASKMRYQDYIDTANRNLQAYGLATDRGLGDANVLTQRLGLTPELLDSVMRMSGGSAELMQQGGMIQQQNAQAGIDNDLQRFQYQMQRPFMGYDMATDLLSRLAAGYGTTNQQGTTTTTQKTGGLAPIVAGAMGAASMIGGFPMAGGGSAGGSLVSSLFGAKK